MIRKREDIKQEIKERKSALGAMINNSIIAEKRSDECITSIKDKLSELASETCFEDTLEGGIKALENVAFGEIERILEDLSKATGKDYKSSPPAPIFLTIDREGNLS